MTADNLRQLRELLKARATLALLPHRAETAIRAGCGAMLASDETPPRVRPAARAIGECLSGGARCQTSHVDMVLTYMATIRRAA